MRVPGTSAAAYLAALTSASFGVVAAALLASACADEAPVVAASKSSRVLGPTVEPFSDPRWSPAPGEQDPLAASVGDATIPRSRVEAALAPSAEDPDQPATAKQALERLVELEVLAQEAVRRGSHTSPDVHARWRQALVQAWLRERFERDVRPESITAKQVEGIYYTPRIRKLYDHADAWRMAHLFIGCCDPKTEDCSTEPVIACYQEAAGPIHEVYAEVKERARLVEGEPDAVMQLLKSYRAEVETRLPQLAYRDRAFYYDPDVPHAEQKGYNILNEAVARTVIEAPLAVLQEPIQSPFGWHILVKLDHVPEDRRGPGDPDVAADIRKNAFPRFQEARIREQLAELHTRYGVQIDDAALTLLDR